MADYPSGMTAGLGTTREKLRKRAEDHRIEQAWNDFRSAFSTVVPVEETELARILAGAIQACSREAEGD